MPTYIPAGRTSIVHRDDGSFQIQTEYAYRPYPRITTSIILNGQLVNKQEQKLEEVISSIEEQNEVQDRIQKQHIRIVGQTKRSGLPKAEPVKPITNAEQPDVASEISILSSQDKIENVQEVEPVISGNIEDPQRESLPKPYPTAETNDQPDEHPTTNIKDMLSSLNGFEYLFMLTSDGDFKTEASREQFTKDFKKIAKSVHELIEIFPSYSGDEGRREQGVYEVKRDRLYFVSTGETCFFVTVRPSGDPVPYEQVLKDMFVPTELSQMLKRMNT